MKDGLPNLGNIFKRFIDAKKAQEAFTDLLEYEPTISLNIKLPEPHRKGASRSRY